MTRRSATVLRLVLPAMTCAVLSSAGIVPASLAAEAILAPAHGELARTSHQLTDGRLVIDLPAFTDDLAIRLVTP